VTARVALVTGCGKQDGFGQQIARTLAASGVTVAISDGDISHEDEARKLVADAETRYGRLDILVNNASPPHGFDLGVEGDVWDTVIRIHLRGTYLMSRFAIPVMRRQRYGRIINIAAAAPHSASKAAVLGFTRALSTDVAPWGITVNAIAPGQVRTGPAMLSESPAPGVGAAVAYLASGSMTGQMLVLDDDGTPPLPQPRPPEGGLTLTRRTSPPFRADHVGSLLRPQRLHQARDDFAQGRIKAADLRAVEDEEITRAVRMQEDLGLQSATDGEFRRATWHMDFIYSLGGISKAPGNLAVKFVNPSGTIEWTPAALHVGSKVRLDHTIFGDDFTFLKSQVSTAVPKLTIPSPNMVHYRGGPAMLDPRVYPDIEEFWADLAAAYAGQVRRLGELGCTYLQFDDTSLAYLNDPAQRAEIAGRGEDAEHLHLRYINQINAAIKDKPAGMAITTHMCRGNFRSSWVASGGYDFVAEALFSQLNVDGFFLEYDDERSGGFEPLRFVPPGKMVVLGLVTTKRPELESKDDLKRRVEQAAKYVPADQLCLSGQCGFSSTVEGNALTHDQQLAKLRLIVETAQEIWG
jgi:5-methyltetrahydropteroyltriglutamate--homocysteine methyltransferase